MEKLSISRQEALELVKKYNSDERDLIHYLESEAIMREVASKLGEDVGYWGMLGLLHDIDWGLTKEDVSSHLTKAPRLLKEAGFDDEFISAVLSHGYDYEELPHLKDKKRIKKIEFALAASETLTGLIHAYALMRGGKISDMGVAGLRKKFKDKAFAAGCDREIIKEAENFMNFDEFLQCGIEGIKKIKEKAGLC
ncbi:HDIG domain-containing protein [Candidatus Pacearchaeota archaeon]|nr:HDIG domain-containing protein [Candidatus Pacearchaeota archaeon]